ncbi:MAG: hypothetical protein U0441_23005 [Polyangiaceae bacterium]
MNKKSLLSLVFVAVLPQLAACAYTAPPPTDPEFRGQTYPQAMDAFCNVDRLAGVAKDEDAFEAGRKRNEWIRANVENPDGIYLRTILSTKGPVDQAKDLRDEAKDVGLTTCALADELEKTGMGGIAP